MSTPLPMFPARRATSRTYQEPVIVDENGDAILWLSPNGVNNGRVKASYILTELVTDGGDSLVDEGSRSFAAWI